MTHNFGTLFQYDDCDVDRHEHTFHYCRLLKDLGSHKKGEIIPHIALDHFDGSLTIMGETEEGDEIFEQYDANYTLRSK